MTVDDHGLDSVRLALQLQSEELEGLSDNIKGRHKESVSDDLGCAIVEYQIELQRVLTCIEDQLFCRSIAEAIFNDRHIIQAELRAEQDFQDDKKLAQGLATTDEGGPVEKKGFDKDIALPPTPSGTDDLAKLSAKYVSIVQGTELYFDSSDNLSVEEGESSKNTLQIRAPRRHETKLRCSCCTESFAFWQVARLTCSHEYCSGCLDRLFQDATMDESLFPPRCCKIDISFDQIRHFLTESIARKFKEKAPELRTPNRTFCCRPKCNSWVPPEHIVSDIATCPSCQSQTCAICKQNAHSGDCPEDKPLQDFLQEAENNRWQRCYRCRAMVELNFGCNHITCRCKAQFCYICGNAWKTCTCPQWDENRLYRRAHQIINREQPAANAVVGVNEDEAELEALHQAVEPVQVGAAPVEEARVPQLDEPGIQAMTMRVRNVMENLRTNHECTHDRWSSVPPMPDPGMSEVQI